jgi:hypothetical protein
MSQIKGKTVFMVLYNYSDCDYSIVIIMENLDDAYKYICDNDIDGNCSECKLINVKTPDDIVKKYYADCLNICYISSCKYNKFNLWQGYQEHVCHYAIVPMVIN